MKRLITRITYALLFVLTFSCAVMAQAPLSIPYQAVARDTLGNIIANQPVSLRFSIRDSITTGTILYQETQSATTNKLGLVTVIVGQGTVIMGSFGSINWGINAKYMQVELDPTGKANYSTIGTTQMLSVPYALYANTAGNGGGSSGETVIQVVGTEPVTVSQDSVYVTIPGLTATVNVPVNSKIIVRTTGEVTTTSTAAGGLSGGFFGVTQTPEGYSDAIVSVLLDGNAPAADSAGSMVIFVSNTNDIYGAFAPYFIERVYDGNTIGVGSHTFSIGAVDIEPTAGSPFIISGNNTALQSEMTIEIIK